MEQEEQLCVEVEIVKDYMSAGGGCKTAVTVRKKYVWVAFWECDELLYGRRFPLSPKGTVFKSYVRPAIMYEAETWFLEESVLGILQRTV